LSDDVTVLWQVSKKRVQYDVYHGGIG